MWWSMPETEPPAGGPAVRRLALAGTIERNQRTVLTSVVLADVGKEAFGPLLRSAGGRLVSEEGGVSVWRPANGSWSATISG